MQKDVLIIGQGICGTFLHWYLEKDGISSVVLDDNRPLSASRIAAGVINPVTGRRIVNTWMIEELLPFVRETYSQIGNELGIDCFFEKKIVDFFPSPQMRIAFTERINTDNNYLQWPAQENQWLDLFNYEFGFGEITPAYFVHLQLLLPAYRKKLQAAGLLIEETLNSEALTISQNKIHYKDIEAGKIIFCDGSSTFVNPRFNLLPFAPNKGEALLVEIPGLPKEFLFKKGMSLVPFRENTWWAGSSYEWQFENDQPTELFRNKTLSLLKHWLKIPFTLVDHLAAVRPATIERRPFVGMHPLHPQIGILNGMGTKGCSIGPYFAKQLASHLAHGGSILPEADIQRFSRSLQRGTRS